MGYVLSADSAERSARIRPGAGKRRDLAVAHARRHLVTPLWGIGDPLDRASGSLLILA
jgi:hypothetical protein